MKQPKELKPLAPRNPDLGWQPAETPSQIQAHFGEFPVQCYYHPAHELCVVSGISVSQASGAMQFELNVSKRGNRQPYEAEWRMTLLHFGLTSCRDGGSAGAIRTFYKRVPGQVQVRVKEDQDVQERVVWTPEGV